MLAHMARTARSRLLLWGTTAVCGALLIGSAWAQIAGGAQTQAAYREWRRLSQGEVDCVDRTLRRQGTTLWNQIQRGVEPSSAVGKRLRSACGAQAETKPQPKPQALAHQAPPQAASQALAAMTDTATSAQADKVALDKAAMDKAAMDKAAADKAAADRAAAEKAAAAEQAAAVRAAAEQAAAEKAAADRPPVQLAKADTDGSAAESASAESDAEGPQRTALVPGAVAASPAAELRISFVYGLICGPVLFILGGIAFLLTQRRKRVTTAETAAAWSDEFDRLVVAVMAEIDRRQHKTAAVANAHRAQRAGDAPVR
jgi:hypothetical protein